MKNYSISVIVPVFNAEKFLCRCLDSILKQSFSEWECLLINDGSTDRSGDICNMYINIDKRFKVYHITNGGVSNARNIGIKHATGNFITFIDSDDWFHPKCFEYCIDKLNSIDVDLLQFGYQYIDQNSRVLKERKLNDICLPVNKYIKLDRINVSVWGSIFKKKIIDNNLISFDISMKLAEDQKFLFDYLSHTSTIQSVDKVFYYYFKNNGSVTKNAKSKDLLYCASQMIEYKKVNTGFIILCERIILNHLIALLKYNDVNKAQYMYLGNNICSNPMLLTSSIVRRIFLLLYKVNSIMTINLGIIFRRLIQI